MDPLLVLLKQHRAGDERAYSVFCAETIPRMQAFLRKKVEGTGVEADDVIQAVHDRFSRLLGEPDFAIPESPMTYLISSCKNELIDMLRKSNREREATTAVCDAGTISAIPTPEESALQKERVEMVNLAISQLQDKDQEIIRLKMAGMTIQDIGDAVDLAPSTVHARLERIHRELHTGLRSQQS